MAFQAKTQARKCLLNCLLPVGAVLEEAHPPARLRHDVDVDDGRDLPELGGLRYGDGRLARSAARLPLGRAQHGGDEGGLVQHARAPPVVHRVLVLALPLYHQPEERLRVLGSCYSVVSWDLTAALNLLSVSSFSAK